VGELEPKPVSAADPFGVEPAPWYRGRVDAPSRQVRVVAVTTGLIVWAAQGQIHGFWAKMAFFALVVAVPGWALEAWWRARRRRRSEELLRRFPDRPQLVSKTR
jgi:hypothetical protein